MERLAIADCQGLREWKMATDWAADVKKYAAKADDAVDIFTDGSCSGNPGPGGWGAVLRWRGHEYGYTVTAPTREAAIEQARVECYHKTSHMGN